MMKNALLTMAVAAACFSYGAQADEKTGGDIVVTYQNDVATLDPAIGYDWQNWSMIKSLFDGLMDYRPGTTELVNDLAESYAISEDGKVYTGRGADNDIIVSSAKAYVNAINRMIQTARSKQGK